VTLPGWMSDKAAKQRQNRSSARQERRHAREVGGRVQAGSGSSWRAKGDVKSAEHMDELKETDGRSFSLTMLVIRKIMRAGEQSGREPRLIVDFKAYGVRAVVTFEDIP
jgi:hypothetical protein